MSAPSASVGGGNVKHVRPPGGLTLVLLTLVEVPFNSFCVAKPAGSKVMLVETLRRQRAGPLKLWGN